MPRYTFKEFKSDQEVRWCPGCGDHGVLAALQKRRRIDAEGRVAVLPFAGLLSVDEDDRTLHHAVEVEEPLLLRRIETSGNLEVLHVPRVAVPGELARLVRLVREERGLDCPVVRQLNILEPVPVRRHHRRAFEILPHVLELPAEVKARPLARSRAADHQCRQKRQCSNLLHSRILSKILKNNINSRPSCHYDS